jgi:hypothetical protein
VLATGRLRAMQCAKTINNQHAFKLGKSDGLDGRGVSVIYIRLSKTHLVALVELLP